MNKEAGNVWFSEIEPPHDELTRRAVAYRRLVLDRKTDQLF